MEHNTWPYARVFLVFSRRRHGRVSNARKHRDSTCWLEITHLGRSGVGRKEHGAWNMEHSISTARGVLHHHSEITDARTTENTLASQQLSQPATFLATSRFGQTLPTWAVHSFRAGNKDVRGTASGKLGRVPVTKREGRNQLLPAPLSRCQAIRYSVLTYLTLALLVGHLTTYSTCAITPYTNPLDGPVFALSSRDVSHISIWKSGWDSLDSTATMLKGS